MPKRKASNVINLPAQRAEPETQPCAAGYVTSVTCFARELEEIWRGKSPYRCGCPLCRPDIWCVARPPRGGICGRPRRREGAAAKYPFCASHYTEFVDCWPAPSDAALAELRDWATAGARVAGRVVGAGALATTTEIHQVFLERARREEAALDNDETRAYVARLMKRAQV